MGLLDRLHDRKVLREHDQADLLRAGFREDMHAYEKGLLQSTSGDPTRISQEDVIDRLAAKVMSEGIGVSALVRVIDGTLSPLEHRLVDRAMEKVQRIRGSHY